MCVQTLSRVEFTIWGAVNANFKDSKNSSGVCFNKSAAWIEFVDHTIEE